MKVQILLAGALLVATTLLFGQTGAPAGGGGASEVGRYQISVVPTAASGSITYMVDTTTGDIWGRNSQDGKWVYHGDPVKDPGRK